MPRRRKQKPPAKSPGDRQSEPPIVDDFLSRRHDSLRQVRQWLSQTKAEHATPGQINDLLGRIESLDADGVEALARLILDDDDHIVGLATFALLELDPEIRDPVLERLLESPQTDEKLKALLAVIMSGEETDDGLDELLEGDITPESAGEALEHLFEHSSWRDVVMTWQSLEEEMPEEELPTVLDALLARGDAAIAPILRYMAWTADVETRRMLATELGRIDHPNVLSILRILMDDADMTTRMNAQETYDARLKALKEASDGKLDEQALLAPPGTYLKGMMSHSADTGEIALVYARQNEDGENDLYGAIIDTWDEGLALLWREEDSSAEKIDPWFAAWQDEAPTDFEPVDENAVAYIVREARRLSWERGYRVPDEFYWDEWYLPYPYRRPDDLPLVFGAFCVMCDETVRRGGKRKSPIIAGDLLICAKCARKKPPCDVCGKKTSVIGASIAMSDEGKPVFVCPECRSDIRLDDDE